MGQKLYDDSLHDCIKGIGPEFFDNFPPWNLETLSSSARQIRDWFKLVYVHMPIHTYRFDIYLAKGDGWVSNTAVLSRIGGLCSSLKHESYPNPIRRYTGCPFMMRTHAADVSAQCSRVPCKSRAGFCFVVCRRSYQARYSVPSGASSRASHTALRPPSL